MFSDSHLHTTAPARPPTHNVINKRKKNGGLAPPVCAQLCMLPVFRDVTTEWPCLMWVFCVGKEDIGWGPVVTARLCLATPSPARKARAV